MLGPPVGPAPWACTHWQWLGFITQYFPFEDPDFDAKNSVGCCGNLGGVVDFGAKGVQRHTSFTGPFGTSNLGTVETTAHLDF